MPGQPSASAFDETDLQPGARDWRNRLLLLLLLGLTAIQLLLLAYVIYRRVPYPFALYDAEPLYTQPAERLARGENVYVRDPLYAPALYLPLYFQIAGKLLLAGLNARLLSVTSAVLLALCALVTVRLLGGRWLSGLFAGALSLLLFWNTGRVYDVIRADTFSLALAALGMVFIVWGLRKQHWSLVVIAGILTGLAGLAKQHYLLLGVFWLPVLWPRNRRLCEAFAAAFFATALGGLAWYLHFFGYGLWETCFLMPLREAKHWAKLPLILAYLLLAAPLLPYLLFSRAKNPAWRLLLWPTVAVGLMGVASFLKAGGIPNSLLPVAFFVAVAGGFVLQEALQAPAGRASALLGMLLLTVVILGPPRGRLLTGAYPQPGDLAAMQELTSVVRALPGHRLLMPRNGYFVPRAAGKEPSPDVHTIISERVWAGLAPHPAVVSALRAADYDFLVGPLYQLEAYLSPEYVYIGQLQRPQVYPYDPHLTMDRGLFPRQLWVRTDRWTPDARSRMLRVSDRLEQLEFSPVVGNRLEPALTTFATRR